ncbi:hypothetical protein FHS16_003688 [Paenibacillus endophyticus]|uniref:Uncharacterized protein n=1 Tax=Paenibacillus endophyticus TaxID=1294268 RepID=A0A7W5C9K7_9BACL|nr:hypothetical protein [Paenibacillus endophyticus]MBB3153613.1 hypothetical protein [Paenibacillus endophyticus]
MHHGTEWTVEEDALAFLTDAGLAGRLTMPQQGRWQTSGEPAVDQFLTKTEERLAE